MKKVGSIVLLILCFACNKGETKIVELSCGQCQFHLNTQDGCDLAMRIDGNSYFVDGADIDEFGDAHDKDTGFCEVIRQAEVTGTLVEDRFIISSIQLLD